MMTPPMMTDSDIQELEQYRQERQCIEHVDNPVSSRTCHACGKRGATPISEWVEVVARGERALIALRQLRPLQQELADIGWIKGHEAISIIDSALNWKL